MSRDLLATRRNLSPYQRLDLYVRLRQASLDTKVAKVVRAQNRLAARHILGFIDSPDYDIMLRLQVLEGIATGKVGTNSTWWKMGRRGLQAARDALQGSPVDPSWFSQGNTGMVGKIIAMRKNAHRAWSTRYTMVSSVEDLMTNMVMGLGADGTSPMRQGPIALQVGAKNPGVKKNVLGGSEKPSDTAGTVGKLVVKKMQDTLSKGDRNRVSPVTEEGGSVFDQMQSGGADIFDVLADLLHDPRSPVHDIILSAFESQLGQGKWASIAQELFTAELTGKRIKKQDLAAKHGMAPGTLSKVIRLHVKPAVESLKKDRRFQGKVMDIAEAAMRRRACQRVASRFMEAGRK